MGAFYHHLVANLLAPGLMRNGWRRLHVAQPVISYKAGYTYQKSMLLEGILEASDDERHSTHKTAATSQQLYE